MSATTAVPTAAQEGMPIAAVEQATGIARATLRIWERRYGFPRPGRDLRGERNYSPQQVAKLRLIADLMARGHRPGRLVELSDTELASLAGPPASGGGRLPAVDDPVVTALRSSDAAAVLRLLDDGVRRLGLAGFVTERMPQMNVNVGLAWARGELQVYEEHLYTDLVRDVLHRHLAQQAPVPGDGPRVLLATLPEESHALGLAMAKVMLTLEGCACTSLGPRVPVPQLVIAAGAYRADVVGLSFTASVNPTHVLRGLEQLRGELAPQVRVWAGGSSPVLARHRIAGVQAMPHIRDVIPAVAHWRATQEALAIR